MARAALAITLAYAWCAAPWIMQGRWAHAQAAPAAPSAQPLDPARAAEAEASMRNSFAALDALRREMPAQTFEPQAVIEQVGRSPDKLFEWVRDNTFWVPYHGTLRGPIGVLMDRLGNSLDRSLLLATLLREAGYSARLAHATLDEAQGRAEISKARPVPAEALPAEEETEASDEAVNQRLDRLAAQYKLDAAGIRESIEIAEQGADRQAREAGDRVKVQAPALIAAVGKPAASQQIPGQVDPLDAARDHWWVQVQQDGAWVDLDPMHADAAPGKAVVAAGETVEPESLDPKLAHTLGIRVVIEQWNNGQLSENEVLSHQLHPGEAFDTDITLTHNPMTWPKSLDLTREKDPDGRLKKVIEDQTEWMPVLWVGGRSIAKASFTVEGDVNANPQPNPASQLGGATGGLFGGAGLGGGGGEKAKSSKRLTAEWIEYTIQAPGEAPRVIRRAVFDLLGPAARAQKPAPAPSVDVEPAKLQFGLAMLGQTQMLAQVCRLSPRYIERRAIATTLASRDAMLATLRAAAGNADDAVASEAESGYEIGSGELYSLAMVRSQWSQQRGNLYIDRINLLTYHTQMSQAEDGSLIACQGYDIVANDMAVRAGAGVDPVQARIEQGVLETNAEGILMDACGREHNTGTLFSKLAGKEWLTVRDASDPAWQQLSLPTDIKARIGQDLAAGQVVVVPIRMPEGGRIAWWRVDPVTGQTIGIGDRGWGQSMTENAIHNVRIVINILDTLLCLRAVSGSSASNRAKGAGIAMCLLKGTIKQTGFLVKTPSKLGAGLIIDMFGDFAGTLGGYAVKEFVK